MSDIQLFDNPEFGKVRAMLDENGEPLFVARDVTDALCLDRTATRRIDDDEKGVHSMHTPGGEQQVTFVTEAGFYKLALQSRKPEAKAFQRWVTHEVLPALRRDGAYVASDGTEDDATLMARALFAAKRQMDVRDATIRSLRSKNAELSRKACLYEAWVDDADGLISVTRAGKLLKSVDPTMGAKRLRGLLRRDGYIERRTLSATVKAIEPGYMRERMVTIPRSDGRSDVKSYGCLTAKGVSMCAMRYCGQVSLDV